MLSEKSSGKSGSFFFYSEDGNYLIKTIYKKEFDILLEILPDYYDHLVKNKETRLC